MLETAYEVEIGVSYIVHATIACKALWTILVQLSKGLYALGDCPRRAMQPRMAKMRTMRIVRPVRSMITPPASIAAAAEGTEVAMKTASKRAKKVATEFILTRRVSGVDWQSVAQLFAPSQTSRRCTRQEAPS